MNKQFLLAAALIIGLATATPAQAGWFSFGGIMGTGAGDTGFGTNQMAGHQEKKTKAQKNKHLASTKGEHTSFVTPAVKSASRD